MKKLCVVLVMGAALAGAAFADNFDSTGEPVKQTVIMRLDTGNRVTTDDIQRLFTALATSYLKSNTNYMIFSDVYRDQGRQDTRSSLVISEADYGDFSLISIRYTFSNGYLEFKLSRDPFTYTDKQEMISSVSYDGVLDDALYVQLNNRLQEVVYVSRGYAAQFKKKSTASFYWFK